MMTAVFIEHVGRAFVDSLVLFFLVVGIIKLLRVETPQIKIALYLVALVRPVLMLFENVSFAQIRKAPGFIMPNIRMIDPLNIFSFKDFNDPQYLKAVFKSTNVIGMLLAAVSLIAFLMIVLHLVRLSLFYFKLKRLPEAETSRKTELMETLGKLARSSKVDVPALHVIDAEHPPAFAIGIFNPTIVISKHLAESVPTEVLNYVMAHEIAHIKRRDSIIRWVALIMRDILFFSPFAWMLYRRLEDEMEFACDSMAASFTGRTAKEAGAMLFSVGEYFVSHEPQFLPVRPSNNALPKGGSLLARRISVLANGGVKTGVSPIRWTLAITACVPLFMIRVAPMFRIGGRVIVL